MHEGIMFFECYPDASADNKTIVKNKDTESEIKKYSYQDLKWHVNIIGHLSFKIIYVCFGCLQFFATWAGLAKFFDYDSIFIWLASLVLGFIPVIGTGFGIFGAHIGWGWSLFDSILIFFIIPYSICNVPIYIIGIIDMYRDWKRWQSCEKSIL